MNTEEKQLAWRLALFVAFFAGKALLISLVARSVRRQLEALASSKQ